MLSICPDPATWRARFSSMVGDLDDCWQWTGYCEPDGYGVFSFRGANGGQRSTTAHRAAYLAFIGEIPDGFEVDHICRNHGCINPVHLEPVMPRVNKQRGHVARAAGVDDFLTVAGVYAERFAIHRDERRAQVASVLADDRAAAFADTDAPGQPANIKKWQLVVLPVPGGNERLRDMMAAIDRVRPK